MIRVFIVDRAKQMGDVMVQMMACEPDIKVIGSATTVVGALPYVEDSDIILVSATLPNDGALQLTRIVAERHPSTRVVIMDWAESQEALRQYVAAGLAAYVFEDESVEDLLDKMRAAHLSAGSSSRYDYPSLLLPARARGQ